MKYFFLTVRVKVGASVLHYKSASFGGGGKQTNIVFLSEALSSFQVTQFVFSHDAPTYGFQLIWGEGTGIDTFVLFLRKMSSPIFWHILMC